MVIMLFACKMKEFVLFAKGDKGRTIRYKSIKL